MSMFLDQVTFGRQSCKGGDGMVAFRREKYVPDGGPAVVMAAVGRCYSSR